MIEERTFAKRGMVDNALKFRNIACKRTAERMNARTPDSENELCLVSMEVWWRTDDKLKTQTV